MSTTQILLTGETGFLGQRVRLCLEADPELTVRPLGMRLDELQPGDHGDVDVVIHLAAWTTKIAGVSDVKRIVSSNVLGLQALLSALDPSPRRVMLASTADVYGWRGEGELTERSPLDPIDSYAASKLLGEHITFEDGHARGYEVCVMRIGHLYGPGEEAYEKFVPSAIRALMKGRPPTVVGDGQTRRDLLYVDDAAEAIRRLAVLGHGMPQCVNLAAAETYTLEEIAQTLIDIVGFIGGIRYLSDHANPASVSFDTTLLRQTIGDWHRVGLSDGLRREIEHVVALERASMDVIGRG
ncbi:MAG TPA: NAD-dependent epimerase/dehydratase family protein [Solirubrobacteraceae bacterium]